MARTTKVVLVKDPQRGDEVPLAVLADRYDLRANTVSCRYRAGKRGADLVVPVNEKRQPEHLRKGSTAKPPACCRQTIVEAALTRPAVRQLSVRRLADLGRVASASKGAVA